MRPRYRRTVDEKQLPRSSSSAVADGVAVRHVPTGRFLGPALVLVEWADAITFDSAEVADRFLLRHASEPCYDVITPAAHFVS